MNRTEISLYKLSGITPGNFEFTGYNGYAVATLNVEFMRLGFVMSYELHTLLCRTPVNVLESHIVRSVIPTLKKMKGADVEYTPFYPNFPQQVMEASDFELYINAMVHYWSQGTWLPKYAKDMRQFALESTNLKEIGVVTDEEFMGIFSSIVSANDSISVTDIAIAEWYMNNYTNLSFPESIPFKENMCVLAGRALQGGAPSTTFEGLIKTSTDVLRVLTYMSGGDISLASNTKFDSLKRPIRKRIVRALERVITEEDIRRHQNKWKRAFHNLHVGEYSFAPKVKCIANKVRSGEKLYSTNGVIQNKINTGDYIGASALLKTRPGDFARRLDHLLRISPSESAKWVQHAFLTVADKVSTRVLLQVLAHFYNRSNGNNRVVFPKGLTQKARILQPLSGTVDAGSVVIGIRKVLMDRFSTLKPLGKVFVDTALQGCPVPAQQRSASTGSEVTRGTRLPMGTQDADTLRLFIYWVGRDIDLSATLHDANFRTLGNCSWRNVADHYFDVYQSGDITNAPNGASEFIDISIGGALSAGVRYVAMNVLVYSGPAFKDHKACYAGWMYRSKPKSNEIYDPATVQTKIDLTMDSTHSVPVLFDLLKKEVIWADLKPNQLGNVDRYGWARTVEGNKASIEQVLESLLSLDNKPTLYDLGMLHGEARGILVGDPTEADFIFGLEGNITPKDINTIHSEYMI